ncbi:hypothetical protein [Chryseobacterium sp. M5A1_1a]
MKPIEAHNNFIPEMIDLDFFWSNVKFKVVNKEFDFISLLKKSIGGQILFKGFQFEENDVFDWYFGRGLLREMNFNTYFLLSEPVLNEFKVYIDPVTGITKASAIDKQPNFSRVNGLRIDGILATLLYYGGAYRSKFKGSTYDSKKLAQKFCKELFDDDYTYQSIICWSSGTAWNNWFIDFIIDDTFLILCMKTRTLWMLAHTDQA